MIIKRIVRFYCEGIRNMTWGRQLWVIVIVKLIVLFGIIKLFFFPAVEPTINK